MRKEFLRGNQLVKRQEQNHFYLLANKSEVKSKLLLQIIVLMNLLFVLAARKWQMKRPWRMNKNVVTTLMMRKKSQVSEGHSLEEALERSPLEETLEKTLEPLTNFNPETNAKSFSFDSHKNWKEVDMIIFVPDFVQVKGKPIKNLSAPAWIVQRNGDHIEHGPDMKKTKD
ncbi:hypothetical protein Bca4012_092849 [Brassica carinata]